jgi:tRNA1(Val) A37 N6-methylase TrmN6
MAISYNNAAFDTTSGSASAVETAKAEMEKTFNNATVAGLKGQVDMMKTGVDQLQTKQKTDTLNSVLENAKAVRL